VRLEVREDGSGDGVILDVYVNNRLRVAWAGAGLGAGADVRPATASTLVTGKWDGDVSQCEPFIGHATIAGDPTPWTFFDSGEGSGACGLTGTPAGFTFVCEAPPPPRRRAVARR
jgi:hypothetical protein